MPYERIVQWAAGPIAIFAGWLATQLVANIHIFGQLGLGKDKVAHAIVLAASFVVGALVTYAAHHKWLSNLPTWWASSGLTEPSLPENEIGPEPGGVDVKRQLDSAKTPDAEPPVVSSDPAFQAPPGFKLVPDAPADAPPAV